MLVNICHKVYYLLSTVYYNESIIQNMLIILAYQTSFTKENVTGQFARYPAPSVSLPSQGRRLMIRRMINHMTMRPNHALMFIGVPTMMCI